MSKKEKVILFGKGMVYERKKERLFRDYDVTVILDNGVTLEADGGTEWENGIQVVNPAEIIRYPEGKILLLSYAVGEMYNQLRSLGVDGERIGFGVMEKPYNTFERMLFSDGGELVFEEGEIFYRNDAWGLYLKTDASDLEKLSESVKGTPLYPDSRRILEGLALEPLDDTYGMGRGTPVDRYYIEAFLDCHKDLIRGRVMEIGDRFYTEKFGGNRVRESVILHVDREAPEIGQIKGDLSTGEGLEAERVNCLICTQTLPFIYDFASAAEHMVGILESGGAALITAGGISQIIQYEKIHYGHFWSFTEQSLRRLFESMEDVESVEVRVYGNVKTASAFLYGISSEELEEKELDYRDSCYQVIIGVLVKKR